MADTRVSNFGVVKEKTLFSNMEHKTSRILLYGVALLSILGKISFYSDIVRERLVKSLHTGLLVLEYVMNVMNGHTKKKKSSFQDVFL